MTARIRMLRWSTAAILICMASTATAQRFSWGFAGVKDEDINALSQCQSLDIQIYSPLRTTPPYTFWAIPVNGLPMRYDLGNSFAATQQLQYSAGTQVIFLLHDITGYSAGVSYLYSVQASSDSSCLPTSVKPSPLRMSINTTTLGACEPLGVGFSGGTPPYIAGFPTLNTWEYTNTSLRQGNYGYHYTNSLPAGSRFLAMGIDSAGNVAITSTVISSTGTNQTVCPNMSGVSQTAYPGTDTAGLSSNHTDNSSISAGTIAGAVVGAVVGLVVVAAFIYLFITQCRKRRARRVQKAEVSPFSMDAYDKPHSGLDEEDHVTEQTPLSTISAASHIRHQSVDEGSSSGGGQTDMTQRSPSQTLSAYRDTASSRSGSAIRPYSEIATSMARSSSPASHQATTGGEEQVESHVPSSYVSNPDDGEIDGDHGTGSRPSSHVQTSPSSPRRPLPLTPRNRQSGGLEQAGQISAADVLAQKVRDARPQPERQSQVLQHEDAGPAEGTVEVPPAYMWR